MKLSFLLFFCILCGVWLVALVSETKELGTDVLHLVSLF